MVSTLGNNSIVVYREKSYNPQDILVSDVSRREDGALEGSYMEYYDNGSLKVKGTYNDGKCVGLYEEYHENGQLMFSANYVDGKREGTVTVYRPDGSVLMLLDYTDGKVSI
jgi:antitoxin component YwqK of YwqJK toxin-antitoxin module